MHSKLKASSFWLTGSNDSLLQPVNTAKKLDRGYPKRKYFFSLGNCNSLITEWGKKRLNHVSLKSFPGIWWTNRSGHWNVSVLFFFRFFKKILLDFLQIFLYLRFIFGGSITVFFPLFIKQPQRWVLESVMCSCAYLQANYK